MTEWTLTLVEAPVSGPAPPLGCGIYPTEARAVTAALRREAEYQGVPVPVALEWGDIPVGGRRRRCRVVRIATGTRGYWLIRSQEPMPDSMGALSRGRRRPRTLGRWPRRRRKAIDLMNQKDATPDIEDTMSTEDLSVEAGIRIEGADDGMA